MFGLSHMRVRGRNFVREAGCRSSGAFTLAEILLAIALIAAMVALIAGAMGVSEKALQQRPPEVVLATAIKRARDIARDSGRSAGMSFDERGFFLIFDIETSKPLMRVFLDSEKNKKYLEHSKKSKNGAVDEFDSKAFAEKFFTSLSEDSDDPMDLFSDEGDGDFWDDSKPKFEFHQIYPKLVNTVPLKFPEAPIKFLRFSPDGCMTHAKITMSIGESETEFESDIFCAPPKIMEEEQL